MKYFFLFWIVSTSLYSECLKVGILGEFKTTTYRTSYSYGKEINRGIEVAKELKLNNCFSFSKIDIGNNIANINGLIKKYHKDKGIRYFIGLGTSEQTHAAISAVNETDSLLISPTATDDAILKKSENVILLSSLNSALAEKVVLEAKRRGIKDVAMIYGKNNLYSKSMANFFREACVKHNLNLIYEEGIRIGRSSTISNMKDDEFKKASAIFLPVFEHDVVKVLGYLHSKKIGTKVIGADSWGSDSKIIKTLPNKVKKKILFSVTSYDTSNNIVKENDFYLKYKNKYDSDPLDIAAFSFEALSLLDSKNNDFISDKKIGQFSYKGTTGEVKVVNNRVNRDVFFRDI